MTGADSSPATSAPGHLSALIARWEARSRDALPADAMLINRHVRELQETLSALPPSPAALAGHWIDVRNRLPTHNYSVLGVVVDGPLVVAGDPDDRLRDVVSYEPTRGWLQYVGEVDGLEVVVTVTHWQDMSELP